MTNRVSCAGPVPARCVLIRSGVDFRVQSALPPRQGRSRSFSAGAAPDGVGSGPAKEFETARQRRASIGSSFPGRLFRGVDQLPQQVFKYGLPASGSLLPRDDKDRKSFALWQKADPERRGLVLQEDPHLRRRIQEAGQAPAAVSTSRDPEVAVRYASSNPLFVQQHGAHLYVIDPGRLPRDSLVDAEKELGAGIDHGEREVVVLARAVPSHAVLGAVRRESSGRNVWVPNPVYADDAPPADRPSGPGKGAAAPADAETN